MNLLLWLIFGALAGWLAGLLMGKRGSLAINILIGVAGAALGGGIAWLLGLGGITGFNLYSLLIAVGGACLLLALVNLTRRR